jgi:hypothetical protein
MDVTKMYESEAPYLKAVDHEGMNRQCVIKDAGTDTLNFPGKAPQEGCWINVGAAKPIWLSKTNGRTLVGAYGGNTGDWLQKKVLVTTRPYDMEGKKTVGWVITPLLDRPAPGFNDDIPF